MAAAEPAPTDESPPVTDPDGWVRRSWLLAAVWLIFLYFPVRQILTSDAPFPLIVLAWVGIGVFVPSYLLGFRLGTARGWGVASPIGWAFFASMVGCAALTVPAIGDDVVGFAPYLMAYATYVLGRVPSLIINIGLPIAAPVVILLTGGLGERVFFVGFLAVLAAMNLLLRWFISRGIEADELTESLATSRARESMARDVHDLVGHSLTVVKLKAEVARRVIDRDPALAKLELDQIIALSAEAMRGVRSAVTGIRSETIEVQLAATIEALRSGGIGVTVKGTSHALSPAQAIPASWILREATTNVLRHAEATNVQIEFAPGTLRIDDDGVGPPELPPADSNGLRGMTERAAEAGARLELASGSLGGTRVEVTW